jgi:hypothetical protein
MGPLLDCLRALGGSAKPREVSAWIAESQKISGQKREETLKSGEERFPQPSRVGTAVFGLGRAVGRIKARHLAINA